MTISRKMARIGLIIAYTTIALAIIAAIASSRLMFLIAIICTAITLCIGILYNHCPHCGRIFRGMFWSKPDAGYCRHCGTLLEYDD